MDGASNVCVETRGFRRKTGLKNGKEAIFEALSGVPRGPNRCKTSSAMDGASFVRIKNR